MSVLAGRPDICSVLLPARASVYAAGVSDFTPLPFISILGASVQHPLSGLLVAYGALLSHLLMDGLACQLPEYCAAVLNVAWTRRVAALADWVQWHDAADGVPMLASRVAAARGTLTARVPAVPHS